jgi:hypothetical protein
MNLMIIFLNNKELFKFFIYKGGAYSDEEVYTV